MKRLVTIFIAIAIVAGAFIARGPISERLDLELRHQVIAVVSRFTSPKPDTADNVQVTPTVNNPVGVNTFLEQEVDTDVRRRTVEMIRDA
ncbi:MAG TPA: hypothetical protein VHX16_15720, partial [Chloroflexota bacterium]|nr:hypothetical protein [Chloroflexota bacterium]